MNEDSRPEEDSEEPSPCATGEEHDVDTATIPPPSTERNLTDILICCFFVAIFVFIGLPVWYKTTTVSRVSLPLDEIESLKTYHGDQERRDLDPSSKDIASVEPAQRWKTFWNLPPTSAIDIVFTLVNPSPSEMTVHWEAENGLKKYLDPTLAHLSGIADFTVSSQILRYIDEEVIVSFDSVGNRSTVSLREASKIINHIESRLGTFSSNNHVLNFIVYVPPPLKRPLKLLGTDGKPVVTNSFITPRWGGVLVYSPSAASSVPETGSTDVDFKEVTEVFLTQFYVHLGLFDDLPPLMKKRAELNIDESISTLKSLASLLGHMGSIAINDVVGENIFDAVRYINDAQEALKNERYLDALNLSRQAWKNSEQAFYDPSLLEQLYFPDDQKFAIYVPLFLPAALPVLMSLSQIIKWWKDRRLKMCKAKIKTQ